MNKSLRIMILVSAVLGPPTGILVAQDQFTPRQRQIHREQQRLSSSEVEERRDALMKLAALKHPDAARAAIVGLNDPEPIVRVTAAHVIIALPPTEAAGLLIPLTRDKLEFVRREAAYGLGETRSRSAAGPLLELLTADKEASVRAAAAIALGRIRDESAVVALTQVLSGPSMKKKSKARENEFVMRAAAQALGEIRNRAAVPVLIATLGNDANSGDVRRAAATALGQIGDGTATSALQAASSSEDPYLSEAARAALRTLRASQK